MALGAKFISKKVQCCGEKDFLLYCCYIAPPAPLKSTKKEVAKCREHKETNNIKSLVSFFPVLLDEH